MAPAGDRQGELRAKECSTFEAERATGTTPGRYDRTVPVETNPRPDPPPATSEFEPEVAELGHGTLCCFRDWPNPGIPNVAAGG
jgi:hypothetical protein